MSFPPPPGLQQPSRPSSAQPHSSLPPRPPSASFTSNAPGAAGNARHAFTGFQPRAVAASQPYRSHSPAISAPFTPAAGYSTPTTTYSAGFQQAQPQYPQPPQVYQQQSSSYYPQQQQYGNPSYSQPPTSQRTPYPQDHGYNAGSRGSFGRAGDSTVDPETEAQIAQWQSAYMSKEEGSQAASGSNKFTTGRRDDNSAATGANTGPLGNFQRVHDSSATSTPPSGAQAAVSTLASSQQNHPNQQESGKTVVRSGGGQTWTDPTLLEWDPAHFRLFCGNLAGEVTDDSLLKAFSKYPSVQKARVIRDKRTEKSKGFGFVSFSDGEDYFRAAREMQGKYIGSHPVLLRRAMTEIRPVTVGKGGKGPKKGGHNAKGGGKGSNSGGKTTDGGIQKKQAKTRGGLKIIG